MATLQDEFAGLASCRIEDKPIVGRHLFAEHVFSSVTGMPNGAHVDVLSNSI